MIRAAVAALALLAEPAAAEIAWITSQNAGIVSRVDAATGAVLSQTPLPGDPAGVAADADGGAWVVTPAAPALHRLDPDGRVTGMVPLAGGPFGVAVNPARGVVYVGDWFGARLWEVDAATLAIRRALIAGASPSGIAVAPDGSWLAVTDRDDDALRLIDAVTGAARVVKVGARPFGVTIHDGAVFTADVGTNTVTVVDPDAASVIGTVPVGERPYAIAFAGGRGFVTDQYDDTLTVFDAATLAVIDTIVVGEYPEGIDATADGSAVLVAHWMSNQLLRIDAQTLAITGDWPMPDGPRAFGTFLTRP